ncbi:protein FAM192A-like [Centruroides sculpturatus]|uniref:protein FAM192A-like n=1 Tax=Centruroides sculpturatus TaxID=218467 RepID=UPI000C6D894A|nr:protein FAM192A-like [Centruroides sculpturatus]
MTSDNSGTSKFKSFVSETELEERRKRRQEEWEKVRRPDQPLLCPEEEYDPKSLYERLQEQKDKKQAEYEEAHRLKNLIRGLDDDEVAFLELVDKTKMEIESKRLKEDMKEIQEYRKAVASLSDEAESTKLKEIKKLVSGQSSSGSSKRQTDLSKAIKRKGTENASQAKKLKTDETEQKDEKDVTPEQTTSSTKDADSSTVEDATESSFNTRNEENAEESVASKPNNGYNTKPTEQYTITSSLRSIGILPGLGAYSDSSDSDKSSSSDIDQDNVCYDLVGRRLLRSSRSHNHS